LKKKLDSWKKSKLSGNETYFLGRYGIKVYPVYIISDWFIEVNNNDKIKRYPKKVTTAILNESLEKTVVYHYKLLKKEVMNLEKNGVYETKMNNFLKFIRKTEFLYYFVLCKKDGELIPEKRNSNGVVVVRSERTYTEETVLTFKKVNK